MKRRAWTEDTLKHIHEREYRKQAATPESVAGVLSLGLDQTTELLTRLEATDLVRWREGALHLTKEGRRYARQVVRAHRLYETHLARETGMDARLWHHEAEKREHELSHADVNQLAARLGHPRFDPHGDPIPTPDGEMPPPQGKPLLGHPLGWAGQLVHIEDEPQGVYDQLMAHHLAPGMHVKIVGAGSQLIRVNVEGRVIDLTHPMAMNVMAVEMPHSEGFDEGVGRLSELREGERASIVGLSPACRGLERSRLLDLGLVPGSRVERDMVAPSGNPVAYVVRGAAIALRTEQAERIFIRKSGA